MDTEPAIATEVTKDDLHDAAEDLVQLQAEIEELNTPCVILSAMRTGMTLIKLFESKLVKLDDTLAGHTIATLICGGIFKDENQDKALIIPWSSTDPDSKINCYFWPKDDSKWQIPRS
eukprot:7916829-Ditylum_brightwellii.AAC.1